MSPAPARVDELKKRYEENPRRFFAPLANEYRKAGDLDAAIDLCRMHLEEQPGHLSGHIVYGQALYESSRPADARTAFEAALTLDPENLIALRHLGDIAKADGDAATATHWYTRVLDADPRNDEVIALIEGLKHPAPASTVVVAEEHAPPPAPGYGEASAVGAPPPVDPHAPTPVLPFVAVEPPAARGSIGLMDLDLNLADTTDATVDLLNMGSISAPPALSESGPPAVDEPAPSFEEGFPLAEGALPAAAGERPELLGVDDANLGLAGDAGVEVQDTSFGVDVPFEEEATFATAHGESTFGDSLDVTASMDFDAPPPAAGPLDELPMLDVGDSAPIVEPITSVSGLDAEPAAPATGDFDMLFGNAPIADVNIGGGAEEPGIGDAGFIADSFIGREPTEGLLASAPDIATPPSPFVTETMAELYLQQGFRDEALGVYRQLLAQNPDDQGLAERVRHLEHGGRASLSIDRASDAIEAAAIAEEALRADALPHAAAPQEPATPADVVEVVAPVPSQDISHVAESAAPDEPAAATAQAREEPAPAAADLPFVFEPAHEFSTDVVAPLPEAMPAFLVEAPAPPAAAAEPSAAPVEPEPVPAAAVVDASSAPTPIVPLPSVAVPTVAAARGPSAREVFARIANRRAIPGGAVAVAEPVQSDARETAPTDVATSAPAEAVAAARVAPGGALDHLFGMGGVVAVDEGAAVAMSTAFGGTPEAPIRGQPTRAVSGELSLDSVFKGGEESAPKPAAVQRQSTKLRFDQFFAGTDANGVPGDAPHADPAPAPGKSEEDIAQFTDWLKGLKGT